MRIFQVLTLIAILIPGVVLAQTGRIEGVMTDAQTGETLIGANVLIEGTTLGAATNIEGYYNILNVPPGIYTLRASMVGFTTVHIEEVRVSIGQTTTIDIELREQELVGEEIVVTAQRPLVQRDVSASTANINARDIEALPVSSVTQVVGLQAGIQGLTVRGSGSDQLAFMVNGFMMRDERDNTPYTGMSLTAVEEIQVQTGGFNAEYGNVRSGIVNVVTKEGRRDRYTADVLVHYTPPQRKQFGHAPNDPNSYWMRPYLDDEVAWTGTDNGAWNVHTQRQYPEFEGWIAVAQRTLRDGDPSTDLTPQAAQEVFLWQTRKNMQIQAPDYDLDLTVGGPLPGLEPLGNLRFSASFRQTQEMYIVPLSRDRYQDYTAHVKLTSDVGVGMKLNVDMQFGEATGTNSNNAGLPGMFRSASSIAGQMSRVSFIDSRLFASDYWAPTRRLNNLIGARFTHAVDPNTFYEISLQRSESRYRTGPSALRDTTGVIQIGGVWYDEAPFGFWPQPANSIAGMRMGVGMSNSRDSSEVAVYSGRGDLTRQVNRYVQVKTGLEFVYSDSRVNYASVDEYLPSGRSRTVWNADPTRAGAYAQTKLEYMQMVANLGLRLDYSHAGGDWYVYDPFDRAFTARNSPGIDTLLATEPTDRKFTLSPRLGISFPVTDDSKLYFNYGHFRSMPLPENLYLLRRWSDNQAVARIADPNIPLPQTVAYELGYEQNLFDRFLVRIAGYYRDIALQPRLVTFQSRDGQVNYTVSQPNNYQDTRGFEFTVQQRPTRWMSGFVNYTYMVTTSGFFGFGQYFENPADQRRFERETREHYQSRPVPRPYARANLDFYTPRGFGPEFAGVRPLSDWRLNLLAVWQSGFHFTWTGGGAVPGIQNNVQWQGFYDVTARLNRRVNLPGNRRAQFFVQVDNLLNTRYMSQAGFVDGDDYNRYMQSLHLPEGIGNELSAYINIPGSDRPGQYRRWDVPFQPMEGVRNTQELGSPDPFTIYYESTTGRFMQFSDGAWRQVEQSRLDQVLRDRAYIDMPNQQFFTFLDPRQFTFGVRISL